MWDHDLERLLQGSIDRRPGVETHLVASGRNDGTGRANACTDGSAVATSNDATDDSARSATNNALLDIVATVGLGLYRHR